MQTEEIFFKIFWQDSHDRLECLCFKAICKTFLRLTVSAPQTLSENIELLFRTESSGPGAYSLIIKTSSTWNISFQTFMVLWKNHMGFTEGEADRITCWGDSACLLRDSCLRQPAWNCTSPPLMGQSFSLGSAGWPVGMGLLWPISVWNCG